VLELVDGPTLADRLSHGPIALPDATAIARQIADALECAHERGIIHRDLKPANVKVQDDGSVKVLDFGLAKAADPSGEQSSDAMISPTMTARGTQLGIVLGTAAYMSPEQARGRVVDRRADIWAFGVVLYEMLSGRRAFAGEDVSLTLASVLKDDVDWKALPPDLPPSIVRMLRRCLEKDPRRRLSAIGDARLELDDVTAPGDAPVTVVPTPLPRWRRAVPWLVASLGLIAAATALWAPWERVATLSPVRVESRIGSDAVFDDTIGGSLAISPDGQTLALTAVDAKGVRQLYVRPLSELHPVPLTGAEGAAMPFFSPDGQWIGFFAGGKLKKVRTAGGSPVTLSDAPNPRGGTWAHDGTIIFQPNVGVRGGLHRVSDAGGSATPVGELAPGEITQRWPQALLGSQAVLYAGHSSTTNWDAANVMVQPLKGGPPRQIRAGGYYPRYVASGHLLYMRDGMLFGAPFDRDRLETAGNPTPVAEGVLGSIVTGGAQFAVSNAGTMVYEAGQGIGRTAPMHWMDADGTTTTLRAEPAEWFQPRFSPDGRKLAMSIRHGGDSDIFIYEPQRDLTKLTFDSSFDMAPVWTPDGKWIAFSSDRASSSAGNIYWKRSDGTGSIERLTDSPNRQAPQSFHPSGRYLAFQETPPSGGGDVMVLALEGDPSTGWKAGTPKPFLATPAIEVNPMFSPDGRWIAYMSNETGTMEVYVRPFPVGDGKWNISRGLGSQPTWSPSRDAQELFYTVPGPEGAVMVVSYRALGESFEASRPRSWSPQGIMMPGGPYRYYDVHPDGKRIVMMRRPEATADGRDSIVIVFNFLDELPRKGVAR
jgi:serine/threonine-protein kinase